MRTSSRKAMAHIMPTNQPARAILIVRRSVKEEDHMVSLVGGYTVVVFTLSSSAETVKPAVMGRDPSPSDPVVTSISSSPADATDVKFIVSNTAAAVEDGKSEAAADAAVDEDDAATGSRLRMPPSVAKDAMMVRRRWPLVTGVL